MLPKGSGLVVDLEESAAVSAPGKRLPASWASPLQANLTVSVSKLQQIRIVWHSGEPSESANTLNVSSQDQESPWAPSAQPVQTIPWSRMCTMWCGQVGCGVYAPELGRLPLGPGTTGPRPMPSGSQPLGVWAAHLTDPDRILFV